MNEFDDNFGTACRSGGASAGKASKEAGMVADQGTEAAQRSLRHAGQDFS